MNDPIFVNISIIHPRHTPRLTSPARHSRLTPLASLSYFTPRAPPPQESHHHLHRERRLACDKSQEPTSFRFRQRLKKHLVPLHSNLSTPRRKRSSLPTSSLDSIASEMDWSPDFCLACDRQTDGNVYCSEACRLAEYEKSSSNADSTASSPPSPRALPWPTTKPSNGFFMEPAYNFSNAQPYGTTPSPRAPNFCPSSRPQTAPVTLNPQPVLTPSSSQSSLFSMRSNTSTTTTESTQLSEESRKALRAYASSFDQSRYSRRQST